MLFSAMGNYNKLSKPDRYLTLRDGVYTYVRRIPSDVTSTDSRSPNVRIKREVYEKADDQLWLALRRGGGDNNAARDMYEAAVARAASIGIEYRDVTQFAAMRVEELIQQFTEAVSLSATEGVMSGQQTVQASRPHGLGAES